MSDSDPTPQITLQVSTQDDAAEVYIIDGSLTWSRVAWPVQYFPARPGVYSVKLRTGYQTANNCDAEPDQPGPVYQNFEDKIPFTSPARCWKPSACIHIKSTAPRMKAARCTSMRQRQQHLPVCARLDFIFRQPGIRAPARAEPVEGLTLRSQARDVLVDFSSLSAANPPLAAFEDPWRACNLELNPGAYRLCWSCPLATAWKPV